MQNFIIKSVHQKRSTAAMSVRNACIIANHTNGMHNTAHLCIVAVASSCYLACRFPLTHKSLLLELGIQRQLGFDLFVCMFDVKVYLYWVSPFGAHEQRKV
jgi:hypothetical protein